MGGTFPAPALPPQGETGKGESNQNSLLPQAITYWLMPESALSPQPPNSLEPLEAWHSQFLKRVKPASLGGTNGCTQSGPPMLTIQAKPTYITYSCSQPFFVGGQLRVENQFGGRFTGVLLPEPYELENLIGLLAFCHTGVGVAQNSLFGIARQEDQNPLLRAAAAGNIVFF